MSSHPVGDTAESYRPVPLGVQARSRLGVQARSRLGVQERSRRRVLVLAFDPLTESMPGPAIRAWNLARELAREHEVVLAGTAGATRSDPIMEVRAISGDDVESLARQSDAIFGPVSVVRRHPAVVASGRPLCIDMYIPTHLENLEALAEPGSPEHHAAVAHQVAVINDDLRAGDFFLCASERQRDFWLGSLASLGRLNPANYGADPTMRRLIDVVPFGLDETPPGGPTGALRRAFPAIQPGDPVVIWAGGVYNWFDPLSLLRAIDTLRSRPGSGRPNIRMVFLGMRNPNPGIPEMRVAAELRQESERLGLTGTNVFFNEGWVPYDQRGAFLSEADIGVSTHLDHVETRFSFRTRVLDYLWAGLPTVLTGGDTLSESIAGAGLGETVPPGDPGAIAEAIDRLLEHPPGRDAVRAFGGSLSWDRVSAPLVEYCRAPWTAPDRQQARAGRAAPADAKPAGGNPVAQPRPPGRRLASAILRRYPSLRRLVDQIRSEIQPGSAAQ